MKNIFLALLAIASLSACQKEKEGNLAIKGNIKGLKKGTLYFSELQDSTFVAIDSVVFNGSDQFETKMNIDQAKVLFVYLDRGKTNSIDNSISFFAEPGSMEFYSELETFYAKSKFIGSINQKKWDEFKKMRSRHIDTELELTKNRLEALKEGKDVAEIDLEIERAIKRRYFFTINFVLSISDLPLAPYLTLTEIPDANPKYLHDIYINLTDKVKASDYGMRLKEYIDQNPVGTTTPTT